ncbi:VOC family protein [bacterium]|nr:VOC family protein [bacterium]MCI0565635.1 VOC family protein [bacterium]MCI0680017.1 VOC family protein [bacterium]
MNRVVHFEIQADDPDRAMRFYKDAFGWSAERFGIDPPYWIITTGPEGEPGINGGLSKRKRAHTGDGAGAFVCTIEVSSIDAAIDTITKNGGEVVMMKTPIPSIGSFAHCRDTEGNIFGIVESDIPEGA